MSESKSEIRKRMIEQRMTLSEEARSAAHEAACERLVSIPLAPQAVVAGYRAMRGELDILRAMLACHDKKFALCLPCISPPQRIMEFRSWHPKMPLQKGAHGTMEPEDSGLTTPTTLWIPLLAFDRRGHRLGYGGGYYDATLAFLRRIHPALYTVGIGFAFQEVECLPSEAHDVMLDMIVTDQEVIQIHKGGHA